MVESTKENQDAELAMREQCDKHGEFKRNADNTLQWDDYMALKKIMLRQSYRLYKPQKDVIDKKRLVAFKAENDGEYFKLWREGQHTRQQN